MYSIELNLTTGNKVTIFFNNNIAVSTSKSTVDGKDVEAVRVMDGLHNNGGWSVKESYKDVIRMIKDARMSQSYSS